MRQALAGASRAALRAHKQIGNPVYEMRDGKVVKVSARSIRIPRVR